MEATAVKTSPFKTFSKYLTGQRTKQNLTQTLRSFEESAGGDGFEHSPPRADPLSTSPPSRRAEAAWGPHRSIYNARPWGLLGQLGYCVNGKVGTNTELVSDQQPHHRQVQNCADRLRVHRDAHTRPPQHLGGHCMPKSPEREVRGASPAGTPCPLGMPASCPLSWPAAIPLSWKKDIKGCRCLQFPE